MKSDEIGSSIDTITAEAIENSAASLIPEGSILIVVRSGILARTVPTALTTREVAVNQDIKALCPVRTVDNRYLHYFLRGAERKILLLVTRGATVHRLSTDNLRSFPIPIPPLPEQKRIVAILDEAFEGIDTAVANTKKNLANARALFDGLLQSALSGQGKIWIEKKLSDVCERITDGTHQTPTYYDKGIVFLSSRNVTSGKIDWRNIKYIDEKQHLEMHKRVAPKMGDILLAKNGTTGVAAIVDRDVVFDIYVSLALLRAKREIDHRFLLYFVNSPIAKKQFNKRLKGIGVPNLHLEEIREVVVSFPHSIQEQRLIVSKLDNVAAEVGRVEDVCQKKLNNLAELKQAILHKAFSGGLTAHPEKALQAAAE